jgi:hypothetical protein
VTGHDGAGNGDGNTAVAMVCLLSCIVVPAAPDLLQSVMDEGGRVVTLRMWRY